jgi:hypothetical protein
VALVKNRRIMIEFVTIIEGIIIMIIGAALILASPMLIVELVGGVLLVVGAIVIIKGFNERYRNP